MNTSDADAQLAYEILRRELLLASLPHVSEYGWSLGALIAGAQGSGLPESDALRLFPGEGDEFLERFEEWADSEMESMLESMDLESIRVRDRIATAVDVRLRILVPYRDAVRRSYASRTVPGTAARGVRSLYRTVDSMWYAAGDTSTDFNYYTKRALLAGVVLASTLYWLSDDSDGSKTRAFVDRRIANVMSIQKLSRSRLFRRFSPCP